MKITRNAIYSIYLVGALGVQSVIAQEYKGLPGTDRVGSALPTDSKQLLIGASAQVDNDPNRIKGNVVTLSTPTSLDGRPQNQAIMVSEARSVESLFYTTWMPYSRFLMNVSMPVQAHFANGFQTNQADRLNGVSTGNLEASMRLNWLQFEHFASGIQGTMGFPTSTKNNVYPVSTMEESGRYYEVMGLSSLSFRFLAAKLNLHTNYGYRSATSQRSFEASQLQIRESIELQLHERYSLYGTYSHTDQRVSLGLSILPTNGWHVGLSLGKSLKSSYQDSRYTDDGKSVAFSYRKVPSYSASAQVSWTFDYNSEKEVQEIHRQLGRGERFTWLTERLPEDRFSAALSETIPLDYDTSGYLGDATTEKLYTLSQKILREDVMIELHSWARPSDAASDVKVSADQAITIAEFLMDHGVKKYRIRLVPHGKVGLHSRSADSLYVAAFDLQQSAKSKNINVSGKIGKGLVRGLVFDNMHHLVGSNIRALDSIVASWSRSPGMLELHTWYGEAAHDVVNQKVGVARGNSVVDYLANKGIPRDMLVVVSHGKGKNDIFKEQQLGIKLTPAMPNMEAQVKSTRVAQMKAKKKVVN